VRGEGAHRTEVTAVEGEHGVGPVLGRERDIDRVSQVQVQVCVLALDHTCGIEDLKAGSRDLETGLPGLVRTKSMIAVRAWDPKRALARWSTSVSTSGEMITVPASCNTARHAADSRALRSDAAMMPEVSATVITGGRPPARLSP
jgi:hypothetical protein